MSQRAWRQIRALRAAPPLLAEEGRRRAVFSAALHQSEELFEAAAAVGPASKPLPLFYALSQAGRAIAAAHNQNIATWDFRGHGLAVRADVHDVRATGVTANASKQGSDAMSSVAAAVLSPSFAGSVTISELVAALPELGELARLHDAAIAALEITPESASPLSHPLLPAARGTVYVRVPPGASADEVLAGYAHVDGYEHLVSPGLLGNNVERLLLSWPARSTPAAAAGTRALRHLADVADHVGGRWFLRPRLGSGGDPPERLLVWWALLLALSSLARYHPAEWAAALDIDACALAVDLEETVRIAEAEVPMLIAAALGSSGQLPHAVRSQWREDQGPPPQ